ncbi:MAG: hypothetical protein WBG71_03365 [Leeuwenhoekiella sp.]
MGILTEVMREYFNSQNQDQLDADLAAVTFEGVRSPSYEELCSSIQMDKMKFSPPIVNTLTKSNPLNPKFPSDFFLKIKSYGQSIVLNC